MSKKKNDNKQQENDGNTIDLTDEFKCAELLLEADEDKEAFKIFLRIATEDNKKRKAAIDKLLYIVLKNPHDSELLDNETWESIEQLSRKGKGYEYADLLLHFKYYSKGEEKPAFNYLLDYFVKKYHSKRKDRSDFHTIMEYFKNDIKEISPIAYLQYGMCMEWGIGIPPKKISGKVAMEYYRIALKAGCLAAYKPIVGLYLYGGRGFDKNMIEAEKELEEGINDLKKRLKKNKREIKPYFEGLVGLCFRGDWVKKMANKGKELAQYMIDNDINGGFYLMGLYYQQGESNYVMAKNYFEEGIKHNEATAYSCLAIINYFVDGNHQDAYKLAYKGFTKNDTWSYSLLGQMYEWQGDLDHSGDVNKRNICYNKAWYYYREAFYKFGIAADLLGRLYLDKEILPNGHEKELESILERGARQLGVESIKCYLRLLQKHNGKDFSKINFENAPIQKRKLYIEFLQLGANNGDDVLREEFGRYIDFVFEHEDEEYKEMLSQKLVKDSYFTSGKKRFVSIINNYRGKQDIPFIVWLCKSLSRQCINNAKELPDEYRLFLRAGTSTSNADLVIGYLNSLDVATKSKLSKRFVEDSDLRIEYMDFIFQHATRGAKAKLSEVLVEDSYFVCSKKQFGFVLENYHGDEDNSFILWLNKSLLTLFSIEKRKRINELVKEFEDAIKKTEDEKIINSWRILRTNSKNTGMKDIMGYLLTCAVHPMNQSKENLSDELAIILSSAEKVEGMKKVSEKLSKELLEFFDSCFAETSDDSSDSNAGNVQEYIVEP